jgi:Fe-Mn family superoxide dismutase
VSGRLFNVWLDEHDAGFPVGASPLLVMDVFEHAYIHDYGMNRSAYVQVFMNAIDRRVIERRFEASTYRTGLAMAVNKKRVG